MKAEVGIVILGILLLLSVLYSANVNDQVLFNKSKIVQLERTVANQQKLITMMVDTLEEFGKTLGIYTTKTNDISLILINHWGEYPPRHLNPKKVSNEEY